LGLGRQTALGLRALGLVGQIGLPGGVECRQIPRQAGDGRHQGRQVGLRQGVPQTFA
jgi:hypothetical protein